MRMGQPEVRQRVCAHFPGFEPLDGAAHHRRYVNAAKQSAAAFGFSVEVSEPAPQATATGFNVTANGDDWETETAMVILDHQPAVAELGGASAAWRIFSGFAAAGLIVGDGAFLRYMRIAWRYGLFFCLPFLFVAGCLALIAAVAFVPLATGLPAVHLLWSLAAAFCLMRFAVIPLLERWNILLLFDQWRHAVRLSAGFNGVNSHLAQRNVDVLAAMFARPADEYLITAHSLGSVHAIKALGDLLQRNPQLFQGKRVSLVTMAGSGLQVSLIRRARDIRAAMVRVLSNPSIYWLDIQCLTDPVHLYASQVARDNARIDRAFEGLGEPDPYTIRVRSMLSAHHYRRIRTNILRVHRQFVLGSDRPSNYDFTMMTAGPYRASTFMCFGPERYPLFEDETMAYKAATEAQ